MVPCVIRQRFPNTATASIAAGLVVAGLVVGGAGRAAALDPSRALTQCVHRIWQTQQGLPQATISCICQTADGYLWLGTPTGLVRFDGVRFTRVRETAGVSLEDLVVRDLREDSEGNLWIATDGAGLFRLRDGTATQYRTADGLPSDHVRSLLVDAHNNVWIGADAGLAKISADKIAAASADEIVAVDEIPDSPLAIADVRAIAAMAGGQIVSGGDGNRLSICDGEQFTAQEIKSLPANAIVQAIHIAKDGAMWVGSSHGLLRLQDGNERRFTTAEGLVDDWVLCLAQSAGGGLFVGTKDGFSRIRGDEIESFRTRDGLSQSTVYALCEDHEGGLWVGTKHGLNQFLERRTIPYTVSEGLPSNDAGPIYQDRQGAIWAGTLDAGLARFDGRRFSAATFGEMLPSKRILALADDRDGNLWIGTDKGLARMHADVSVAVFTKEQGLPSDEIAALCCDQTGTLWVGTAEGLAMFRDGRFVPPQGTTDLARSPVITLLDDQRGHVLAATEGGGLYCCTEKDALPVARGLRTTDAVALFVDADGLLWLGLRDGGLLLIDGDKSSHFTVRDGLFDDDVYGIVADNHDRLWMACSKGIFFVSRASLRSMAAGKLDKLECTTITPTEAQRTIECQSGVQPVVSRMQDGRIWFSSIRGLFVLDPNHLERSLPPSSVVVEEVVVNGKAERPGANQKIPPGKSNISFLYTALSYASPSRIKFRYRLDGFDHDWVDAGSRREAFYTNLPPGDYRFRVSALNIDGVEREAAAPVAVTIVPHFYQTRWFLPVVCALVGLAVWFAYRMRVRRIREQMSLVVAERSRIARELHDTLMQGFSGVTMEMQALASQLPESPERGTLDDIIHDAGVCLREARRSIAGLRGDKSGLAASIEQAARQITETHDIRLRLGLDDNLPSLPTEIEYNLLRIAQEAVTNALKHADARNVEVTLDHSPKEVRLSIKDDGHGFDLEAVDGAVQGHYGLIGMRERAVQIGAEFHVESISGRGTWIRVVVPTAAARVEVRT